MLGKNRIKQIIYGFEIRTTAIIGNGLVHRVPKQKCLKLIRKELDRVSSYANLSLKEKHSLWLDSYARYNKVSKQSFSSLRKSGAYELEYDDELKLRKNIVYGYLRKQFDVLEHNKNELANEYEYRAKDDEVRGLLESGSIFYLCSSHINPAKDHADWEGKIYVDEDWMDKCEDSDKKRIAAYIRNHKIVSVQWVTGAPVWLVYRPNCKHYLIPVSVDEVLGNSAKKLLKEHDMYMENEPEQSYEYGQYKTYYERSKMLQYLKKMFDAEDLDKDLRNTNKLVKKWDLLSKGFGKQSLTESNRASTVGKSA